MYSYNAKIPLKQRPEMHCSLNAIRKEPIYVLYIAYDDDYLKKKIDK